jgi:replicative DNA helicase
MPSNIYGYDDVNKLLGCICNDTSLILNDKYPLKRGEKGDFSECLFHRIIFGACYAMTKQGAKEILPIDIDMFIQNNFGKENYVVFEDNNGIEYITTIKQLSDVKNYDMYYNTVRKYSLLRRYEEKHNISEIWDKDKPDEKNIENLNKWGIEDIINYFDKNQNNIAKEFKLSTHIEEMIVGTDVKELLEQLEETPMIGGGLSSPMLNSLYRGWCKGHLILRGSPSSFGKTTMGIADLCNVSSLKVWSDEKQDFIDNPYYQGKGVYCFSEQKMITEIQPRFLSTISGIPYNKILDGEFTKHEKDRLIEAGDILKESKLKLINYPEFTSSGMKELIRNSSLEGYEYFTQDYVWNNFYIVSDLKQLNGTNSIREDQALLHFVNTLKMSAEQYNMAVSTSIQLNGKQNEIELVDESCLFGSKSIKTKLDNGSIYMQPRKKELFQVESFIVKWNKKYNPNNFGGTIYPNAVSHVFKARYNRYGMNIKIWHYVDNSIGKMTDMFATTWDNKPLTDKDGKIFELPKLYIERKN